MIMYDVAWGEAGALKRRGEECRLHSLERRIEETIVSLSSCVTVASAKKQKTPLSQRRIDGEDGFFFR